MTDKYDRTRADDEQDEARWEEQDTNNTLDKILHRLAQYYEAVGRSKASPNKTDFAKAKKEIESLIADREKKMLEFILPKKINQEKILKAAKSWFKDKQRNAYMAMGVNSTIRHVRQRAKEWREK